MGRNFVQNTSEEKLYDNLTIFDNGNGKTNRKASCNFSGQEVIHLCSFTRSWEVRFVAQLNKVLP